MIKIIQNPPYMTLIHKQSGKKYNTFGVDFLSYDEDKFEVENKLKQNKFKI